MKKTPFISIIVLLVVIVLAFAGCETTVSLDSESTEVPTTIVEITDDSGEVVATESYTLAPSTQENTYVVTVTDKSGEVVGTEVATLSKEEISAGKEFFNIVTTTTKANPGNKTTSTTATTTVSASGNTPGTTGSSAAGNEEIREDKFVVTGRIVSAEGNVTTYKLARNGSMYSMVMDNNGTGMGVIMGAENIYMLLLDEKSYIEVPKSYLEENDTDGTMDAILNFDFTGSESTEVGSFTEKVDGVKYNVVEYDDGSLNYFNGDTLVKTVLGDGSVMYYDSITSQVSAAYFVPPSDYTKMDMTVENLNKFNVTTEPSE